MSGLRISTFDDPSFRILFGGGSMIGCSDSELVRDFLSDEVDAARWRSLPWSSGTGRWFWVSAGASFEMIMQPKTRFRRCSCSSRGRPDRWTWTIRLAAGCTVSPGAWLCGQGRSPRVKSRRRDRRKIHRSIRPRRSLAPRSASWSGSRLHACRANTGKPSRYVTSTGCLTNALPRPLACPSARFAAVSRVPEICCGLAWCRRGLAPAALAAWFSSRETTAAVPRALLESTLKQASGSAILTIPASVAALVDHTMRSLSVAKAIHAGALLAAIGCVATGGLVAVRGNDMAQDTNQQAARNPPAQQVVTAIAVPTLAEKFRKIVKEFDDEKKVAAQEADKGKNAFEKWKIRGAKAPDETSFAHRMVDLAATSPRDQASRDALIWVIDKRYRSDNGSFGDEVQRAVNLLVQHHADDPEVARLGLNLDNLVSRRRDSFLEGIYANAQGSEAKGLARMALAQYLVKKAPEVASARQWKDRGVVRYQSYDQAGNLVEKTTRLSNEEEAYRVHERMLDPQAIRLEAERLFEEVIATVRRNSVHHHPSSRARATRTRNAFGLLHRSQGT